MADTRITIDKDFSKEFKSEIEKIFAKHNFKFNLKRQTVQYRDAVYMFEYELTSNDVDFKCFINMVNVEDSGWLLSVTLQGRDIKRIKTTNELDNEIPQKREFLPAMREVIIDAFSKLEQSYGLPLQKKSNINNLVTASDIRNGNFISIVGSLVLAGHRDQNIVDSILNAVESSDIDKSSFARLPIEIENYRISINNSLKQISSELKKYKLEEE